MSNKKIIKFRGSDEFQEHLNYNPELKDCSLDEQLAHFRMFGVNTQTGCFFREKAVLNVLNEEVIPSYSRGQHVKIASIGCSSGEDIYSVLLSNWDNRHSLTLHGYDINPEMIEVAKAGCFPNMGGFDFEKDFKNRCTESTRSAFRTDGEHLELTESARSKVKFTEYDILSGPLPEQYDIVLLENVLMHYLPKGRTAILKNVNKSLENNGWLLCEKTSSFGPKKWESYQDWMVFIGHTGFKHVGSPFLQNYQKTVSYNTFSMNICMHLLKNLEEIGEKIDTQINKFKYGI